MNQITSMLRELRNEIRKIIFLDSFLNSAIVFLVFYIILTLISIKGLYAFIPFIIAFIFFYKDKLKKTSLAEVEKRNPNVAEMLRTAADNVKVENVVTKQLNEDVLREMKKVATSSFFTPKILTSKIISVSALSLIILFILSSNLHIVDVNNLIKGLGYMPEKVFGSDEGLYGDESAAQLGKEKVTFELNPMSYELNLDQIRPPEKKEFESKYAEDVTATPEKSFEENIPKEQQELVKRYFERINK